LEKDNEQAIKNKKSAEGYFYSWITPGTGKLITTGSWLGALATGAFTTVGSVLAYNVWNNSGIAAKFVGDFFSPSDKLRFLMEQSDYNRAILTMAPALPFTFMGTLVFAGLAKYFSSQIKSYQKRNAQYIEKMEDRYKDNIATIARLQQIAHECGIALQ